jgi:hypothetical protein
MSFCFLFICYFFIKVPVGLIRLPSKMVHRDGTGMGAGAHRLHQRGAAPMGAYPALSPTVTPVPLKEMTLGKQIASEAFISITVFFIITSFWANFFIGR